MGNCAFNIKDTVKSTKGSLKTLIPDIDAVLLRLKRDLLEKIIKNEATTSIHTQTPAEDPPRQQQPNLPSRFEEPRPDPLRIPPNPRYCNLKCYNKKNNVYQ